MKLNKTKKIVGKKIALLICLAMICTLPNIGTLISKKVNANSSTRPLTEDELQDPNKIYVLEIAPGDKFNLSEGDDTSSDGTIIHVDRMDMPSYISKVDEITGKYDVVVISNKKEGLSTSFDPYKVYRTYTNPYTDNAIVAKYLSSNWGTGAITLNNSFIKMGNGAKYNVEEYYPENDITARRAKPIVDMINNGQSVYMDEDIISSNSELKKTKLYQIFTGQYNGLDDGSYAGLGNGIYYKIKQFDSSSISENKLINQIVSDYKAKDISEKRPIVNSGNVPSNEVRSSDGTVTNNRDMQFLLNINVEENRKFKLKLYLDMNNDSLYKESELFNEIEYVGSGIDKDYSISLQLNNNFIGYLSYKIDIVKLDDNGNELVKNSIESHTIFKAQRDKKTINVLQLYPNDDRAPYWDFDNNNAEVNPYTILTKSKNFNSSIKLDDYQINMQSLKVSEFEKKCKTTYSGSEGIATLENEYNMIIIGFADNYNKVDIDEPDAIAALKQFIADGYSVMFTHDTISYHLNENYGDKGTREISRNFRDFVGQARYIDPCRYNSSTAYPDNTNLYKSYDPETEEYEIKTIPHEIRNSSTRYSLGVAAVVADTNQVKGASTGSDLYKQTYTHYVKNINKGQITSYPFDLSVYKDKNKSSYKGYNYSENGDIEVGLTHIQWFQLNLEDEDVVPWYNILGRKTNSAGKSFSNFNSGDSRNFYYTYSKANITYSGTGHSGVTDSEQEIELFVNTIIKAERGGNHTPEINNYLEITDSDNNTILNEINNKVNDKIESEKDFEFISIPVDEDQDKVRVSFSAKDLESGLVFNNIEVVDVNTNQIITPTDKIRTGTKIKVKIPKENYNEEYVVNEFEVTATVKDLIGAESTKTFTVSVNHNPTIKSKTVKDNKTGDDINTKVTVSRKGDYVFAVVPNDIDADDKDKLKVALTAQCEGKDIDYEAKIKNDEDGFDNFDLSQTISSGTPIFITIKKEELNKLTINKGIDIKATVIDSLGAKGEDSFIINISNVAPTIINKKEESNDKLAIIKSYDDENTAKKEAIGADRNKQFSFISILEDEDGDDITASATASGDNVGEINCFVNVSTEQCDNKTTEIEVASVATIDVTIPKSFLQKFIPGEYIKVNVKATDKYGGETIQGFYIKVNTINPNIDHGVLESENNDGDITITPNQKEVEAYSTVNFAGKVSQLFDTSATLKLVVDKDIIVKGTVEVYRLVDGKKCGSWEMTELEDNSNVYSLTLSSSEVLKYGNVENGGMKFIIKYTGELRVGKKNNEKYTNTLSVDGIDKSVDIIPKKGNANMKLF